MESFFQNLNPIMQGFLATLFTWWMTMLGAAMVFFFKNINQRVLNGMLGFASGVMIAASFWSLLDPAIELSKKIGVASWKPALIGFLCGGFFLWSVDKILPHLH
ncbi:ZIP family metal transporter, partial [Cetobacterium sp.]